MNIKLTERVKRILKIASVVAVIMLLETAVFRYRANAVNQGTAVTPQQEPAKQDEAEKKQPDPTVTGEKNSGSDKTDKDTKDNSSVKNTESKKDASADSDSVNADTETEENVDDKEAVVEEDTVRVYPKWQKERKKAVKEYDYLIKVNKTTNTVTVYIKEKDGTLTPFKAMVCSVGREGHSTPEGKGYHTSEYYDWRLMVDNTYGRYAVRFNGSIMFHSVPYYKARKDSLEWEDYNKLGSPASLGCIRLAVADAKWIFDNCRRGTEVEVYSGPASTDPLGTPKPIELDITSEYRDWDPTDLTPENPWLIPVE